jgi:hypothetical protein
MFWLRRWTKTFNFQWERDGLQPEAPFPYRPFADRKIDLRSLSGWVLQVARAINDKDEIVGFGVINGKSRAFLLEPVHRKQ